MPCPVGTKLVPGALTWGGKASVEAPGGGFGPQTVLCRVEVRCQGDVLRIPVQSIDEWRPERIEVTLPVAAAGRLLACAAGVYELVITRPSGPVVADECVVTLAGLAPPPADGPLADPLVIDVADTAGSPYLKASEQAKVVGLALGDDPGQVQVSEVNLPLEVVGPDPAGWSDSQIDVWMPAVGQFAFSSPSDALFKSVRFEVTRSDGRKASYPSNTLQPGEIVYLPPPWIDPANGVRTQGQIDDPIYIGDENRRERGNRLADHLTHLARAGQDDETPSAALYLVAETVGSQPQFAPVDPSALLAAPSGLDGAVKGALDGWATTFRGIPAEAVVRVPVDPWHDSWAVGRLSFPLENTVPAKAKWLFTMREAVPSNVVDVSQLNIQLRLKPLPVPPTLFPPAVILFDQPDFGIAPGAQNVKYTDLTPMVVALVPVRPPVQPLAIADMPAEFARMTGEARAAFARVVGALTLAGFGGVGALLSPPTGFRLAVEFVVGVGEPFLLDRVELRPGGIAGLGRISADDMARSAIVTGPPGTVVRLHHAWDKRNDDGSITNFDGTIQLTVPPSGVATIPAIFRPAETGTALPAAQPPGSAVLLNGQEPPWWWTTFRDAISAVTFMSGPGLPPV